MRDFAKVISLIKAHALLHYCTGYRGRDADGAVIADLRDYRAVRDLVEGTLAQGHEVEVSESVAEVVETVDYLTHEANQRGDDLLPGSYHHTASQIDLVEYLGRDGAVISRNVRKAIEDGYLVDDNPGQGRLSQLRKGERDLPAGRMLPLPQEFARVTKPVDGLVPA